jgi:glycosyltransferase involved in cell wall biosynthesis
MTKTINNSFMIDKSLCKKVLTIGSPYPWGRGGIAQVLTTYQTSVYSDFIYIVKEGGRNKFHSLWVLIRSKIIMIFKLIFDSRIKIVHIHTASSRSFQHSAKYVKIAKFFGKKVVLHVHGGGFKDYYKTNPLWIKKVLDTCDCIIALTENWKIFFTETVGCRKVEVVNNVVEKPVLKTIDRSSEKLNLLFLGFLVKDKGIFDLVDMIAEHKNELDGKILLHIGGKGEHDRLNKLIFESHLEELIKYEGWVSGDIKIDLLNSCDVFILPSYVEGLPISILEAMSYGKIIISTPVGGIPELLNVDNGYIIQPGDKDAMFMTIMNIVNDRASANKKASQAKLSIDANLPENVAIKLTEVYTKLLKE